MTDTFILQLPEFNKNKIYYIPHQKTWGINNNNNNNNNSTANNITITNELGNLTENNRFPVDELDEYDSDYIYENNNNNNNNHIHNNTIVTNNNNLFLDEHDYSLESTLYDDLHFSFSPTYIQEVEYNYQSNSNSNQNFKNNNKSTAPICNNHLSTPPSLSPGTNSNVINTKPIHLNDFYCPLLNNDSISYEQYLKSNTFNNIWNDSSMINIQNGKVQNSTIERDKLSNDNNTLSSFSTYSSLFSNLNNKNSIDINGNNDLLETDDDEDNDDDDEDDDVILLPDWKGKYHQTNPTDNKKTDDFILILEAKLNRYVINERIQNNQDIIDKIRLQEISYRFSKSYF